MPSAARNNARASHSHRMTQSASLINLLRSPTSFLNSSEMDMISRSARDDRRSRTCNPVVPASPSMKIFFFLCSASRAEEVEEVRRGEETTVVETGTNATATVAAAIAISDERADLLIIF